jgi:hypothetical protein
VTIDAIGAQIEIDIEVVISYTISLGVARPGSVELDPDSWMRNLTKHI